MKSSLPTCSRSHPSVCLAARLSVCLLSDGRVSLLQVFDMGEEEHEIVLQKVQEAKVGPPIDLLRAVS